MRILALPALLLATACLVDQDLADERRDELTDSGEAQDTDDTDDTDNTNDGEQVDCSAIVSPPPGGGVRRIGKSGPIFCSLASGPDALTCTSANPDITWVEDIESTAYTTFSLGRGLFCGVRADTRALQCEGNSDLLPGVPEGTFSAAAFTNDPEGNTGCALDTQGQVTCWGNDDFGLVSSAPDEPLCTVDLGQHHACGLRPNGTVLCWGSASEGVVGASAPAGTHRDVSVGRDYACAVASNGDLACWGDGAAGWTDDAAPPTTLEFDWVAAANHSACGIVEDGTLACWGQADTNIDPLPEGTFVQVIGANRDNCALRDDGTHECWGFAPEGPPGGPQ